MDEDKNQGQFAERLRPDTTRQQRADYLKSYREAKGGNYRVMAGPGAKKGRAFDMAEGTAERVNKARGTSYQSRNLQKISGPNINNSEAHMVRDTASGKMMDFKFVNVTERSKRMKAASVAEKQKGSALSKKQGENKQVAEQKGKATEPKVQIQGKGSALSKQNSQSKPAQTQQPAQSRQKKR